MIHHFPAHKMSDSTKQTLVKLKTGVFGKHEKNSVIEKSCLIFDQNRLP